MNGRIGIVAANYYEELVGEMVERAERKAEDSGFETSKVEVAGAFDTPLAADRLARKERIDAVVVVGAIVKGETDHDKVIGDAVANRISDISLERDKPVALGISGPGMSAEQARERKEYGAAAIEAAIKSLKNLDELEG